MKQQIDSYQAAMHELQTIVAKIEANEIPIDDLAAEMKRASILINYCQNKLKGVAVELENLFGQEK